MTSIHTIIIVTLYRMNTILLNISKLLHIVSKMSNFGSKEKKKENNHNCILMSTASETYIYIYI